MKAMMAVARGSATPLSEHSPGELAEPVRALTADAFQAAQPALSLACGAPLRRQGAISLRA